MAFCNTCGTDAGDAKFCPQCGAPQQTADSAASDGSFSGDSNQSGYTEANTVTDNTSPNYSNTGYSSAPETTSDPFGGTETSYSSGAGVPTFDPGNVAQTGSYTAPPVPDFSSGGQITRPSNTGQIVFAIINIVLGLFLCCCGYTPFISFILGIVAVVMAARSSGAPTTQDAENSLRTARILNIIGVVLLGIGIIIWILLISAGTGTAFWQAFIDELEKQGYSYTLINRFHL